MVKSLADSAAQPAITHMLTAMDTPQGWAGVERHLNTEEFRAKEVKDITEALVQSGNIPWFVKATLKGHKGWINSASFSHDGRYVVTASNDSTAKIWNAATGQLIRTLQHQDWVKSASFSHDGRWVVTASRDSTAKIWNAATGQLIRTLQHQDWINSVSFSPDGRWVVTASSDHTAKIWNAATGQLIRTLQHQDWVKSASFSPNGQGIVTASGDRTARIWNAATGQLIRTLQHQGWVQSASFSRDGRWVVTASRDSTAKIWNAATGQLIRTLQHQGVVNPASFSHDGQWIVTAPSDHTARIWKYHTARIWKCGLTDQSVDIKLQLKQLLLQTKLGELHRRGQALPARLLSHLYPIWQTLPRNIKNDLVRQFPLLNIRAAIEPTNYWPTVIAGGFGIAALGAAAYWLLRK